MDLWTHSIRKDDSAFTSCVFRVNVHAPGWQKAVRKVLSSSQGVRSFKMDEYGIVRVSGWIRPKLLMKKLAKAGRYAELCSFQYGLCSSNLFPTDYSYSHNNCYQLSSYDEYGRYYPFRQAFQGACLESPWVDVPPLRAPPMSYEGSGCCTIM